MDIGYAPLSVNISEVALTDFYSRFIINPDGTLNVQNIIAKQGEKSEAEVEAEKKTAAKITKENQAAGQKGRGKERDLLQLTKKILSRKMIRIEKVTLQGGTINFL